MQKVQPAKNNLDMDFLNSFNKPIGGNAAATTTTASPAAAQPVKIEVQAEDVTEIDPTSNLDSEFDTTEIDIEDEAPVSRTIKATQIVVRTTEKEREALKAYFMKHGVSLSKGIKIAIKYLEQQEKKGLVHFSDIGLY
jgi:hypothetical protein